MMLARSSKKGSPARINIRNVFMAPLRKVNKRPGRTLESGSVGTRKQKGNLFSSLRTSGKEAKKTPGAGWGADCLGLSPSGVIFQRDFRKFLHSSSDKRRLSPGIFILAPTAFSSSLKKRGLLWRGFMELAEQDMMIPVPTAKHFQRFYKPSEKYRLIINLRRLNRFQGYKKVHHGEHLLSMQEFSERCVYGDPRSQGCIPSYFRFDRTTRNFCALLWLPRKDTKYTTGSSEPSLSA